MREINKRERKGKEITNKRKKGGDEVTEEEKEKKKMNVSSLHLSF